MKPTLTLAALFIFTASAPTLRATPCEQVKSDIAKKLEAKGVTSYTLDIVDKDKDADGKVVGVCEGGAKKIVYKRGETTPAEPSKP